MVALYHPQAFYKIYDPAVSDKCEPLLEGYFLMVGEYLSCGVMKQ